jgi:hypothetical protein
VSGRRLDRAAAIGVGVLIVTLTFLPLIVGSGGAAQEDSAEFAGDGGRLATFLLFENLGFEPELWTEAPGLLPRGDHVVWAARVPRSLQYRFAGGDWVGSGPDVGPEPDESEEESEPGEGEQAADPLEIPFILHNLNNYGDFVREGGTLVLPGGDETVRALSDSLGLEELDGLGALSGDSVELERLMWGLEELAFVDTIRLLEEPDPELFAEELALTEDGRWFALAVPVGAGRVVLLADDSFLDNPEKQGFLEPPPRGIAAADHALLATRLMEELDRGGRLFFDEYALGRWMPGSAVGLAASGRRGTLTLQLLLFLLVLAWSAMWVREFPRDPEGLARLSPLSRARAQAALLRRAGRFDLLAGMLRRGTLRRLCAIARVRDQGEPTVESEGGSAEAGAWRKWADERLDAVLAAAGAENERARYAGQLFGPEPRVVAELDELTSALEALERHLAAGLGAGSLRAGSSLAGSSPEGTPDKPRRPRDDSGIVAGRAP